MTQVTGSLKTAITSGAVSVTDESIGVRITLFKNGDESVESINPRHESLFIYSDRIEVMREHARVIISELSQPYLVL